MIRTVLDGEYRHTAPASSSPFNQAVINVGCSIKLYVIISMAADLDFQWSLRKVHIAARTCRHGGDLAT